MLKIFRKNTFIQLKSISKYSNSNNVQFARRAMCTADVKEPTKLSGFAQAYEKHSQPAEVQIEEDVQTFESLFQNSKFVDMGDPKNKVVVGKIFHIVENDLYIDFGWKFHCVCTRPVKNGAEYVRGAKVRLRVKNLELSTRFLGSDKDLTILEADCHLLGLISSPARGSN